MPGLLDWGNILVLVKDENLKKLFTSCFDPEFYTLFFCEESSDLFKIIDIKSFGLIFLDFTTPEVDKAQMIKILRTTDSTKGVPIIIIDKYKDLSYIEHGIELGAIDYIIKSELDSKTLKKVTRHNSPH